MRELGGYDRNFICGQSENDLVMRAYAAGAIMLVARKSIAYSSTEKHDGLWHFRGPMAVHEMELMRQRWVYSGNIVRKRQMPFEPYVDEGILEKSQGPHELPIKIKGGEGYKWI